MATLTKRKLIRMGDGGLVVTIPKAWWNYYGLRAGDMVTVIANGELRISPCRPEDDDAEANSYGKAKNT